MDAARTCVRLGCESVTVAYRRSQEQMPALLSEYEEARAEGVQFQWFASPVAVEGKDKVEGFKYEVMALNDDMLPLRIHSLNVHMYEPHPSLRYRHR